MLTVTDVVLAAAACALGGYLYFCLYHRLRVDLFRQALFGIRDELMHDAPAYGIPFDSQGYLVTRTMLNGMIRFAHELSLTRILIIQITNRVLTAKITSVPYDDILGAALDELPSRARDRLIKARSDAHWHAISHVIHTSWLLAPVVIGLKLVLRAANLLRFFAAPLRRLARRPLRAVDREAYLLGIWGT